MGKQGIHQDREDQGQEDTICFFRSSTCMLLLENLSKLLIMPHKGKIMVKKGFIIKNDEFPHSRKYRKPVATCETVDGMLGQSSLFSQEEACSFRARFI